MNKTGMWVLSGTLAVILVATAFWGSREFQDRQRLQNRAESQYQKAYHELTWHMDLISGQLAQLLVVSSREQKTLGLATIWRQVFAAQANIGALPLAFVPFSNSEKFLADTADISFSLLKRSTISQEEISEKDEQLILDLYQRSKALKNELGQVGAKILNQGLSWTEVEVATLTAGKELEDNTIIDGFDLMEKKMEEYPEINLGDGFSQVQPDVKKVDGGSEVNVEKATNIARAWWFGGQEARQASLTYEGMGDIPSYGLEFPALQGESAPVYIEVSKSDGTVIWVIKPKSIETARLDLSAAERFAVSFIEKHGLGQMAVINVESADNSGIYTFVPRQGEVLLYPDEVKIQVSLDNGEIIGYEASAYYMNHKERTLTPPKLSEGQIRTQVNPKLQVELLRPALITNSWGKEILTWEVRGRFNEERFVIFYHADDGSEEAITRVTESPKYEFAVAA